MPFHTNKIGDFQFLDIQGAPYLRQQDLELIERHGVDGTGVRKRGRRGKPFQLETLVYVEDFETASELMAQYALLVGDDPVTLMRQSVDEGTFLVLGVVERQRYAIFQSLGGFDGGEQCCLIASWVLLG